MAAEESDEEENAPLSRRLRPAAKKADDADDDDEDEPLSKRRRPVAKPAADSAAEESDEENKSLSERPRPAEKAVTQDLFEAVDLNPFHDASHDTASGTKGAPAKPIAEEFEQLKDLACGNDALFKALNKPICHAGIDLATLGKQELMARMLAYRERAVAIFQAEIERQLSTAGEHAAGLLAARRNGLEFDKGTRRRGVCKYRCKQCLDRKAVKVVDIATIRIAVSHRLVDYGCPAKELLTLIRHELSHAACPGKGHSEQWKAYNLSVGGDGKRCDDSEVTSSTLGHAVEVYCEAAAGSNNASELKKLDSNKHFFREQQKAPDKRFLTKRCAGCKDAGSTGQLFYRRVSLAATARIE